MHQHVASGATGERDGRQCSGQCLAAAGLLQLDPADGGRDQRRLRAYRGERPATFNDALASAIVNFTSLSDVARTVLSQLATDLIKFALQQIELHTIGAALSAASVATTTAAAAAAGAAWAGPAALASLATLGANAGPGGGGNRQRCRPRDRPRRSQGMGGRIFGSGGDTSDNILTPSSPGELWIRAQSARNRLRHARLYQPARRASAGSRQATARARAARAAEASPRAILASCEGIVSDAIEAMPATSLHPTLSPAARSARRLGDPKGQRADVRLLWQQFVARSRQPQPAGLMTYDVLTPGGAAVALCAGLEPPVRRRRSFLTDIAGPPATEPSSAARTRDEPRLSAQYQTVVSGADRRAADHHLRAGRTSRSSFPTSPDGRC
jgi:hypothetical protein